MKRKIYLEGALGDTFTSVMDADVQTVQEALKLIDANFPNFISYLNQSGQEGVGYIINIADSSVEALEDAILPIKEGDITITPAPIGSKSGLGKILAAVAIAALIVWNPAFAFGANATVTGATATLKGAFALNALGMAAASLAINLAIAGLQQLMAPDPSVDSQSPEGYLFNGSENNIVEGDPVPILYGELVVPGRPISLAVVSRGVPQRNWAINNVMPNVRGSFNSQISYL